MTYIQDSQDAYNQYDRDKERDEQHQEKINEISNKIDDVISLLDDYDTEDNKSMANQIEEAILRLTALVDGL